MYFTNGSSRAFEMLMRGKPGFDRYENGGCADCEDCNTYAGGLDRPPSCAVI